jgi:hypothetical protein
MFAPSPMLSWGIAVEIFYLLYQVICFLVKDFGAKEDNSLIRIFSLPLTLFARKNYH